MENFKINSTIFLNTLIVTFFIVSCKTVKGTKNSVLPDEKAAFYTLCMVKDTLDKKSFFYILKMDVVNNKIRFDDQISNTENPNYLKIEVTYKHEKVVTVYTEHPLHKKFDLYTENGEIESKSILLQRGEVVFRIPYFDAFQKIKITETVNLKTQPYGTIKNTK